MIYLRNYQYPDVTSLQIVSRPFKGKITESSLLMGYADTHLQLLLEYAFPRFQNEPTRCIARVSDREHPAVPHLCPAEWQGAAQLSSFYLSPIICRSVLLRGTLILCLA